MSEVLVLVGASAPGLERLAVMVVHGHGLLLTSAVATYIRSRTYLYFTMRQPVMCK